MSSSTKNLTALLAAGAAGFVLGMLLAPEKGSEIRKTLGGLLEDMGDKFAGLMESSEKLSETVEKAEKIAGDLRTTAEHGSKLVS